ncbi:hypothetical protein [Candidatus Formimonas warabiya]|uniref:Uncharacterized protein n=1 Tax=Formimonas warabiya TaxID=1761012 RepID=A0A3G1KQ13_FORW1|nr:hypothetical protein [Candidatus Formimonas warabiya]ATW24554.1 hypothetical protein DCMF_06945 [Candidatus Formimonas warabiya]
MTSTCPRCGRHDFEVVVNEPKNLAAKLLFVQCSFCGAVIGVTDNNNMGLKVAVMEKEIRRLGDQIGILNTNFSNLVRQMSNLLRK